jgi:hypothetical protein
MALKLELSCEAGGSERPLPCRPNAKQRLTVMDPLLHAALAGNTGLWNNLSCFPFTGKRI